ncbi:helix-turn-helix domain-containing protein [Actinosynnema sp. NPDC059335]|uniref:helix-turn-helix domain-containing protein n=1 Tax=Actinosynnema sp. NPDC059335 TaxID=3346804 RepID=UPI00366C5970
MVRAFVIPRIVSASQVVIDSPRKIFPGWNRCFGRRYWHCLYRDVAGRSAVSQGVAENLFEGKSSVRLSTAHSRELGEELRRVRHRAQMSAAFVSEALGWSLGKLSKLETGTRGTSTCEIGTLLGCCGADKATRERIIAIADEADTGSFLRLHDGSPDSLLALSLHEQTALTVAVYEPLTIPGLAQIEEYARALDGDAAVVEARMARQEVLRRRGGPETALYVHEAALRLVVGGREVMRDQMLRLTLMCGWERMSLRLVPFSAVADAALREPGGLLTFPAPVRPVAYAETGAATVFHDDPQAVAAYEAKMRWVGQLALSVERSRAVFARWADVYDRKAR